MAGPHSHQMPTYRRPWRLKARHEQNPVGTAPLQTGVNVNNPELGPKGASRMTHRYVRGSVGTHFPDGTSCRSRRLASRPLTGHIDMLRSGRLPFCCGVGLSQSSMRPGGSLYSCVVAYRPCRSTNAVLLVDLDDAVHKLARFRHFLRFSHADTSFHTQSRI
jgi:hypothetical protein